MFVHGRGDVPVQVAVRRETLREEREHEAAERGLPRLCLRDISPGSGVPGDAVRSQQPRTEATLLPRIPEEGGHAECSGNSLRWVQVS